MKVPFRYGIVMLVVIVLAGAGALWASQARAANVLGGSPDEAWATSYVSTNPDAGYFVSVALDSDNGDRPWVAYYNKTRGSLMVAHFVGVGKGNCNPNDAWLCVEVDYVEGESKGLYTSIAVHPDSNPDPIFSNWKVGVSYYDETHHALKYAQYRCILTCSWTTMTVDGPGLGGDRYGMFTSLKINQAGIANISYHVYDDMGDFRMGVLKYAYYLGDGSGDCGDDSDWECQAIDSAFTGPAVYFGSHSSLDLDNEDRVYISYYDGNAGDLKLAYYVGFGGACGTGGDWQCIVVDDGNGDDVGQFTSLHALDEAGDAMRIAYYNTTQGALMYAYDIAGTGNCGPSNTWQCNLIDEIGAGHTSISISMAMDPDGLPMIAYTDENTAAQGFVLKAASPAYFQGYANCGGDILFDWYCRVVDPSNFDLSAGEYAGLAVKSNGMAVVAYSEYDDRYGQQEMHLKVTYQAYESLLPLVAK